MSGWGTWADEPEWVRETTWEWEPLAGQRYPGDTGESRRPGAQGRRTDPRPESGSGAAPTPPSGAGFPPDPGQAPGSGGTGGAGRPSGGTRGIGRAGVGDARPPAAAPHDPRTRTPRRGAHAAPTGEHATYDHRQPFGPRPDGTGDRTQRLDPARRADDADTSPERTQRIGPIAPATPPLGEGTTRRIVPRRSDAGTPPAHQRPRPPAAAPVTPAIPSGRATPPPVGRAQPAGPPPPVPPRPPAAQPGARREPPAAAPVTPALPAMPPAVRDAAPPPAVRDAAPPPVVRAAPVAPAPVTPAAPGSDADPGMPRPTAPADPTSPAAGSGGWFDAAPRPPADAGPTTRDSTGGNRRPAPSAEATRELSARMATPPGTDRAATAQPERSLGAALAALLADGSTPRLPGEAPPKLTAPPEPAPPAEADRPATTDASPETGTPGDAQRSPEAQPSPGPGATTHADTTTHTDAPRDADAHAETPADRDAPTSADTADAETSADPPVNADTTTDATAPAHATAPAGAAEQPGTAGNLGTTTDPGSTEVPQAPKDAGLASDSAAITRAEAPTDADSPTQAGPRADAEPFAMTEVPERPAGAQPPAPPADAESRAHAGATQHSDNGEADPGAGRASGTAAETPEGDRPQAGPPDDDGLMGDLPAEPAWFAAAAAGDDEIDAGTDGDIGQRAGGEVEQRTAGEVEQRTDREIGQGAERTGRGIGAGPPQATPTAGVVPGQRGHLGVPVQETPEGAASADTVLPGPETAAGAATALRAPTVLAPVVAPRGRPAPAQRASRADPELVLGNYPWRFHPDTLREIVDDPDELRAVRDRLTAKLQAATLDAARARLLGLRAVVSRILGDLTSALADGRDALEIAERTGELRRTAIVQARLAHVLQWRGDFAEADRLFAEANSPELPDRLRATMHEHAGRSCYDQGRYIEACVHFEKALDLRKVQDPELLARTELALDAVMARVAETGWGPYPRSREEILQLRRPPVPAFSERAQRWGYRDADSSVAVPPRYADAQPFHDDVAWVRRPESAAWELIDLDGETVVDASAGYVGANSFSDGLAWVSRDGQGGWFAIDRTGRTVIGGGFDDVRPFRRGVAAVRRGGWGAVDRAGRMVVPPRYATFVTALTDGRYVDGFTDEGLAIVETRNGKGVVDRGGRVVVAPRHPELVIHPVAFLVGDGAGRWGAVDRRGEPLIDVVHASRTAVTDEIDRLLADTYPLL